MSPFHCHQRARQWFNRAHRAYRARIQIHGVQSITVSTVFMQSSVSVRPGLDADLHLCVVRSSNGYAVLPNAVGKSIAAAHAASQITSALLSPSLTNSSAYAPAEGETVEESGRPKTAVILFALGAAGLPLVTQWPVPVCSCPAAVCVHVCRLLGGESHVNADSVLSAFNDTQSSALYCERSVPSEYNTNLKCE